MKGAIYTIVALLVGMIFLVLVALQQPKFPLHDYFEIKNQVDAFRWNVKLIVNQFIRVKYNGSGYWINATPKQEILGEIEEVAEAQNITYQDNNFSSDIHMWNDHINITYLGSMPVVEYEKPTFIYLEVIGNITRANDILRAGDVPCHIVVRNPTDVILDVYDNISYVDVSRINTDAGWIYIGPYVFVEFNSTMNLFLRMNGSYMLNTNATFIYEDGKFNLTIRAI